MNNQGESFVVAEGYHDRAFWAGLLLHLQCTDLSLRPDGRRVKPSDPFGDPIGIGHYAFCSKSREFIRIVPAKGKALIPNVVRTRLKESEVKPLKRLVVNVDSDLNADGSPSAGYDLTAEKLRLLVREYDPEMQINDDGDLKVNGGQTKLSLVRWESNDAAGAGIPHQNTLERIICASLIAVYPSRGPAVQAWLDSRPDARAAGPKEFAWSYLAGWHADVGSYEGFCNSIWSDSALVEELKKRLNECGALRVALELSN